MIARHVHNHTPDLQLRRKEFNQYEISNDSNFQDQINKNKNYIVIDIDKMPSLI
jgi:hypothetical protein